VIHPYKRREIRSFRFFPPPPYFCDELAVCRRSRNFSFFCRRTNLFFCFLVFVIQTSDWRDLTVKCSSVCNWAALSALVVSQSRAQAIQCKSVVRLSHQSCPQANTSAHSAAPLLGQRSLRGGWFSGNSLLLFSGFIIPRNQKHVSNLEVAAVISPFAYPRFIYD